jgi:hypothetical protein
MIYPAGFLLVEARHLLASYWWRRYLMAVASLFSLLSATSSVRRIRLDSAPTSASALAATCQHSEHIMFKLLSAVPLVVSTVKGMIKWFYAHSILSWQMTVDLKLFGFGRKSN